VIAHGSADDVAQAQEILKRTSLEALDQHQPADLEMALSPQ